MNYETFRPDKKRMVDHRGMPLVKALFCEFHSGHDWKSEPTYTTKDDTHNGYPSLYRLYIQTADPTEYRFAKTYLCGWDHWLGIVESYEMKDAILRWRRELDVLVRSEALAEIITEAKTPESKNRFLANKFLLEGKWKPEGLDVGRPTKAKIKEEAQKIFDLNKLYTHEQELYNELNSGLTDSLTN